MSGTFQATDQIPEIRYSVGAVAQQTFIVPFTYADAADLRVSVNDALVGFNLTPAQASDGFNLGGFVTLLAPVANCRVAVWRAAPLDQRARFPLAGAFSVKVLNREFSRLWLMAQDLRALFTRGLRSPRSEAPVGELPVLALRANRLLGFDAFGQPIAMDVVEATQSVVDAATTARVAAEVAAAQAGFSAGQALAAGTNLAAEGALIVADAATARVQAEVARAVAENARDVAVAAGNQAQVDATSAQASSTIATQQAGIASAVAQQLVDGIGLPPNLSPTVYLGVAQDFGAVAITAPFANERNPANRMDFGRGGGGSINLGGVA